MPSYSRTRIVEAIEGGVVKVDGKRRKPSYALRPGMRVEVQEIAERPMHDLSAANVALEVFYEDEAVLVVNKPRGMATHPAPSQRGATLVNALLGRAHSLSSAGGAFRPGIVHRLDKDTTGLLVVAKNDAAHHELAKQIRARSAERRYVACVAKRPDQNTFVIDGPLARDKTRRDRMAVTLDGKAARTHCRFLREIDGAVQLVVRLETGRTHQIRVHLSAVGIPVIGDKLYNCESSEHPLQLHAAYLRFKHPIEEREVSVFCPPPSDFIGYQKVMAADLERWE